MSLDGALEAFTLADRGGIYLVPGRKDVSFDFLLYFIVLSIVQSELLEESLVGNLRLVN